MTYQDTFGSEYDFSSMTWRHWSWPSNLGTGALVVEDGALFRNNPINSGYTEPSSKLVYPEVQSAYDRYMVDRIVHEMLR